MSKETGSDLSDPVNLVDPEGLLFGGRINAGEQYGASALQYWADWSTDPENTWYETVAYNLMGGLAALWTPCTSDETALTLLTSGGRGRYLGRPFWRYIGPKSNPSSPWLTRGPGWKPPHEKDFNMAKDKLQVPNLPNEVKEITVPWYKPVRGPRPATGNPGWGSGGRPEYYRGWRWP